MSAGAKEGEGKQDVTKDRQERQRKSKTRGRGTEGRKGGGVETSRRRESGGNNLRR